jgi:hypothetical protein
MGADGGDKRRVLARWKIWETERDGSGAGDGRRGGSGEWGKWQVKWEKRGDRRLRESGKREPLDLGGQGCGRECIVWWRAWRF